MNDTVTGANGSTVSGGETTREHLAPRRIAIVIPSLLPLGGVERVVLIQMRALIRLGYDVDLVLVDEPADVSTSVPSGSRVFNLGASRLAGAIMPLALYLRRERPDAMHAAIWPLTSIAIIAHKLARSSARLVVSDHNPLSVQYDGKGLAHRLMLRASLALTYPYASARIAVSSGVADDVARLASMPRAKFSVIYNPTLPSTAHAGNPNQVEAAWEGWAGKRILTVGRFKLQKNHALLIHAFKAVRRSIDAKLMILGCGEREAALRALIHAEELSEHVLLPGHVDDPTPFYNTSDLFVLSSDYEGFGNVLIEALACGLPIVSTDCPSGPAEILENSRYGRLVPINDADALADAIADALVARHDREALKRRAADFTPEIAVEQYLKHLFPIKGQ